jgi:phenylalanyl-tRNA synthetase alpha chain
MKEKIQTIRDAFQEEIQGITSSKSLEQLKVKYLGKKGFIQSLMVDLKDCLPQDRPLVGKLINDLKEEVVGRIECCSVTLSLVEQNEQIAGEKLDVTLPGRRQLLGGVHPISQMIHEVLDILMHMGFSIQTSPEIESDYYNYGGLNYPEDHPARDMQDTFYLTKDLLLRSHTTAIQQR